MQQSLWAFRAISGEGCSNSRCDRTTSALSKKDWLDPKIQKLSILLQLGDTERAGEALAEILNRYPKVGRDPRPGFYAAVLSWVKGEQGEAEVRLEKVWDDGDESWCDDLIDNDPALALVKPWWDKRVASREHSSVEGLDRI